MSLETEVEKSHLFSAGVHKGQFTSPGEEDSKYYDLSSSSRRAQCINGLIVHSCELNVKANSTLCRLTLSFLHIHH
jgi:hypothetical protein